MASKPKRKAADSDQLSNLLFSDAPPDDLALLEGTGLLEKGADAARKQLGKVNQEAAELALVTGNTKDGRSVTIVSIVDKNRPFLFDSLSAEIRSGSHSLMLAIHPIIDVMNRGEKNRAFQKHKRGEKQGEAFSVIQYYLEDLSKEDAKVLHEALEQVLAHVHAAVDDWQPMLARLDTLLNSYKILKSAVMESGEHRGMGEAIAMLEWLRDDNFTFLGMRDYVYSEKGKKATLLRAADGGLGILDDPDIKVLRRGSEPTGLTPELQAFLTGPEPLIVTKSNTRSVVHRREVMDYVGVKHFDEKGQVTGETRIVGLFTSSAYTRSVLEIPFIREKVGAVTAALGFDPSSHSGKALENILETYPRDELFQIDVGTLTSFMPILLDTNVRPRVRVLSRTDRFDRFVSIIVYVPRDHYDSRVRERIGDYFADVFDGHLSAFYPAFPEGGLARVHFIIGRRGGKTPKVKRKELEEAVSAIVKTWDDSFKEHAREQDTPPLPGNLIFSEAYRENFSPSQAVEDAAQLTGLGKAAPIRIEFRHREDDAPHCVNLRIFHFGAPVALSRRVPILENFGFQVVSEQTFSIETKEHDRIVLHEMQLEYSGAGSTGSKSGGSEKFDLEQHGTRLEEAFLSVWHGKVENDPFNRLIVAAGLSARQAFVLRAYARYLRQTGLSLSPNYLAETLNRYPAIAKTIYATFIDRFDPKGRKGRDKEADVHDKAFQDALQNVPSLDDDRILRRFMNAVTATMRTNYFQTDEAGNWREMLAFKFDPKALEGLPEPRPFREMFVYGPPVEGVHLRFGPIARGGIRWSDRAQDYRTEVLGLVKAQQVKNAVIVPVGAKGGFYPKQLPAAGDRQAIYDAGRAAYIVFITTLLSLTDNLVDDKVVHPKDVVCHDGDDPYFVVAADKGTATFSDTANAISQEMDFWLDDAFASGGSAGYDHKAMGITARGAWEAVKRHFREMNRDIQAEPFTVAGVGDMSGDVFGNGMLLSRQIRLVAAFDHRDIFIDPDPDPDPAKTFAERQRMFKLGRSSWQDYNTRLLSKGGMIVSRTEKSVNLSAQAASLLGLETNKATPLEIISAILKSDVDLLWFGGIGTYAKASAESHADVGDRSNDAIRIDAKQIGAKVIGEGANLGLTQRARIEYCLHGGRCNSDAIDNSAGVNSSDMEVNIKIALAAAMKAGKLDRKARNKVLVSMTKDVAELVLRNNYLQTLAISLAEAHSLDEMAVNARFMRSLEERNALDREVETLPDDIAMAERQAAGKPLTRPELGTLLSYAKIVLFDELLESALPDDEYMQATLEDYFPVRMRKDFAPQVKNHRLRREIISTMLANEAINRGGPNFVTRLADATGRLPSAVVRAYLITSDGFDLRGLYDGIDGLDGKIDGTLQNELYASVGRFILSGSVWTLNIHDATTSLKTAIAARRKALKTLAPRMLDIMPAYMVERYEERRNRYTEGGVAKKIAENVALLPPLALVPDIMMASAESGAGLVETARTFFDVTDTFRIGRLAEAARAMVPSDYYEGLALGRAEQTIGEARRTITVAAIQEHGGKDPVRAWHEANALRVERVTRQIYSMAETGDLTVPRLTVAGGLLTDLAGAQGRA